MDSQIGNIIGHDAKDDILLGISGNKKSYLLIKDAGVKVYAISNNKAKEIKESGQFTASKDVKWEEKTTFKSGVRPSNGLFPKWTGTLCATTKIIAFFI